VCSRLLTFYINIKRKDRKNKKDATFLLYGAFVVEETARENNEKSKQKKRLASFFLFSHLRFSFAALSIKKLQQKRSQP
jgi:hypothetical protein